jgi:hemoglobin
MQTSHAGLKITQAEWQASVEMTRKALDRQSVGVNEQLEFLALLERYRNDIVDTDQQGPA